jgi:hypothetical protein
MCEYLVGVSSNRAFHVTGTEVIESGHASSELGQHARFFPR